MGSLQKSVQFLYSGGGGFDVFDISRGKPIFFIKFPKNDLVSKRSNQSQSVKHFTFF